MSDSPTNLTDDSVKPDCTGTTKCRGFLLLQASAEATGSAGTVQLDIRPVDGNGSYRALRVSVNAANGVPHAFITMPVEEGLKYEIKVTHDGNPPTFTLRSVCS